VEEGAEGRRAVAAVVVVGRETYGGGVWEGAVYAVEGLGSGVW